MSWFRRMRALWDGEKREREYEEELQFHLAMREERHREEGMPAGQARRAARLRLGNPTVWRERMREADLLLLPLSVVQDLRFGVRLFLRNPGFTAGAVFALALGIGINTATFTAYQTFFARTLDARDPAHMVSLALIESNGETEPEVSYPDYAAYRDHLHALNGVLAVSRPQYLTLRTRGGVELHAGDGDGSLIGRLGIMEPLMGARETAMTMIVSDNYFSVLGVGPVRGRGFEANGSGGAPSVLISENYWHKRFADDPKIVGRSVLLNGAAFTIIGVTPHNFAGTFVAVPDFWLPLRDEPLVHPDADWLHDREKECCRMLGLLAAGMTMEEAQADLTLEANRLRFLHDPHSERARPAQGLVWAGSPFPSPVGQNHNLQICLRFVMVAVGLVLVVACANVAALQLARAAARSDELAMRLSLGASRMRVIRQLLTESSLLAVTAGVLAFLFSWGFLQLLVVGTADAFPEEYGTFVYHVKPDFGIFAFVLGISLLAGLLFGLAPALESSRAAVRSSLKANAVTSPKRGGGMRGLLVGTQVAVSAVLVIAGSLLIHSAVRAVAMSTGYDDARTIDLTLQFPAGPAYTAAHEASLMVELRDRMAAIPGVAGVTIARAPDDDNIRAAFVARDGEDLPANHLKRNLFYTWVQPNYFETLGIRLLLGQGLDREGSEQEHAVVVSESAARVLWPGQNPLGQKLRLDTRGYYHTATEALPDGPAWRVIGVSGDTRGRTLDGSDSAQIYLPLPGDHVQEYPLLIRTKGDPAGMTAAIAEAVAGVDGNLAAHAQTLKEMLRQTGPFLAPALAAAFASITGIVGLVLAVIGIYGTVSYMVVQRTREMGIRMALGAGRRNIVGLIVRESARPVLAGLSVGVLLACGAAWLLRHILYGIHTIDGISFIGVSLLFLAITPVATLIPSRRAVRVEPVVALRCE